MDSESSAGRVPIRSSMPRWLNTPWLPARTLVEAAIFLLAGLGAFLLRFEFEIPAFYRPHVRIALLTWVVVKLIAFRVYHLDRRSWKFFSADDAFLVAQANAVASLVSAAILLAVAPPGFPRSVPIFDMVLCTGLSGGTFLALRLALRRDKRAEVIEGREVLIYGAGRAGVALLGELKTNSGLGMRVAGFIDDDPALNGMYVNGAQVLGNGSRLRTIAHRAGVKEVLIAVPSATGDQTFEILRHCQQAGVRFRTVAALSEIVEGKGIASQIREVDVQDLLSRTAVNLDHSLISNRLAGKVVMVTGGGGSIGSELCRQIARFKPAAIVAFEVAETPLFHIEREMREQFPDVPFFAEIGNVQNQRRVATVLLAHRPSIIYHAAAYKHVPMMEANLYEAVENNVFGTMNVARAADEYGVQEFVLISSDKAVRPTSFMGATKRLCELLVLSLHSKTTRYVAVRFGNVLGSNGSVIPVFKQQIASGGPVLVTHPEMQRYFMTISEASQLVLQASSMGRGGEIYVLDMGSQVKIVDLARKLIQLSGLVPDVDIKIDFIGVRPGEKLYEELNLDDETTVPTEHRKIKIFAGKEMSAKDMQQMAEHLEALCSTQQGVEMMALIEKMVPEYTPSEQILGSLQEGIPGGEVAEPRKHAVSAQATQRILAVGS